MAYRIVKVECGYCDNGSVYVSKNCSSCDGTGMTKSFFGGDKICGSCEGSGTAYDREDCSSCDGKGYVKETEEYCDICGATSGCDCYASDGENHDCF